jgi:hypothetical protein
LVAEHIRRRDGRRVAPPSRFSGNAVRLRDVGDKGIWGGVLEKKKFDGP